MYVNGWWWGRRFRIWPVRPWKAALPPSLTSSLQGTQSFYGLFSVLKEVKLARVSVGGIGGDVSSFLCWWWNFCNWIIIRNWMVLLWFFWLIGVIIFIKLSETDPLKWYWEFPGFEEMQIFSLIDKVKTGYLALDKIIFSFGHSKFLFSFPPWKSGSGLILCIFSSPVGVGWVGSLFFGIKFLCIIKYEYKINVVL